MFGSYQTKELSSRTVEKAEGDESHNTFHKQSTETVSFTKETSLKVFFRKPLKDQRSRTDFLRSTLPRMVSIGASCISIAEMRTSQLRKACLQVNCGNG